MEIKTAQDINRWHLGEILISARKRAKLPQYKVATHMECSSAFISMLEHGKQAFPTASITKLVSLYSTGDTMEDAKLVLSILYLSSKEQWDVLAPVLAFIMGKDLDALCAGVERTIKLRLLECGIER